MQIDLRATGRKRGLDCEVPQAMPMMQMPMQMPMTMHQPTMLTTAHWADHLQVSKGSPREREAGRRPCKART